MSEDLNKSTEILAGIIKALSSSEEAVVLSDIRQGQTVEFTVRIPKAEAGRVIGKYGDVIKSLRAIMYGVTMHQHRLRSNIIVDPY